MAKKAQNAKMKTVKHTKLNVNPRVSEERFVELLKAMSVQKKEKIGEPNSSPTSK